MVDGAVHSDCVMKGFSFNYILFSVCVHTHVYVYVYVFRLVCGIHMDVRELTFKSQLSPTVWVKLSLLDLVADAITH